MTNKFTTIKDRPRSEKILLVRIKPGRQVIDDLSLVAGTTYTMSFPFPVCAIKVDGVTYDRNELTALSTREFSYNEETQVLNVRLNDSIGEFTAVVVYYYLFYSNTQNRQATEDPEDSTTTLRNWEGRILGYPSFEITQEDIIQSVLTIGNTTLNLINDDDDFQKYLGDNDSFSRKEVKIWQCLNKTANIQKFFFGFVSSITVGNQVSISVDNAFSALQDNFYTNGTSIKSKFNSTDYPNCHPNFKGKPIPKYFSRATRTEDVLYNNKGITSILAQFYFLPFVYSEGSKLINTSYNVNENRTVNRVWSGCVAGTLDNSLTEVAAGVTLIESSITNFYRVNVADNSYYRPGDTIVIDFGSGNDYTCRVSGIPTDKTKLEISTGSNVLTNGMSMTRPDISYIGTSFSDANGSVFYALQYVRDYTFTIDSNGVYQITLADNFEANIGGLYGVADCIKKDQEFVYRAYNHADLSHGNVIKEILEQANLEVDTTSISEANNAAPDIYADFSIPLVNESDFPPITDVIEKLLTSTFSMLSLSNDFKISYHLLESTTSTDEIGENDFLQGSIVQEVRYQDLINELIFQNENSERIYYYLGGWNVPSSMVYRDNQASSSISSDVTEYLHEIKKQKTINHIIDDISFFKQRMIDVLSNRKLNISLNTKGINFTSKLNDNFILVTNKVLGSLGQKNIKLFSINKSANETKIKGLDLLGL